MERRPPNGRLTCGEGGPPTVNEQLKVLTRDGHCCRRAPSCTPGHDIDTSRCGRYQRGEPVDHRVVQGAVREKARGGILGVEPTVKQCNKAIAPCCGNCFRTTARPRWGRGARAGIEPNFGALPAKPCQIRGCAEWISDSRCNHQRRRLPCPGLKVRPATGEVAMRKWGNRSRPCAIDGCGRTIEARPHPKGCRRQDQCACCGNNDASTAKIRS